jgi:hypothetical protein
MSYLKKPATTVAMVLVATALFAQDVPRYQIVHSVADPAADGIYICEDGVALGQASWGDATPFLGSVTPGEREFAIGLDENCATTIANTPFTVEADGSYQFFAIGVTDPESFAANPDGLETGVQFAVNDSATVEAPEGNVFFSVVHAIPDAPEVTGLVYAGETLIDQADLGGFGTVTPNLFLPSVLGTVRIDVVPTADLETVVESVELDLAAFDGQSLTFVATGFLDPAANGGGPGFSGLAVFPDGTTSFLLGGPVAGRTVTLRLNSATLPDTTGTADGIMQVRGCLEGCEGDMSSLPDGNVIAWNDATTLEPANDGGDYWSINFQIPENVKAFFKFFSNQAEETASAGGPGGWEDGNNHEIEAGTGDVTLDLHYFEKGDDQEYDWTPFPDKGDSVGVHFRVYMDTEDAITKAYDRETAEIGIRGAAVGDGVPGSPLDWGATNVMLSPESDDDTKTGYHIWSGMGYWGPDAVGSEQAYKFFIEPDGWEADFEGGNRTFVVPAQDTTIHWVLFSESPAITGTGPQTATVIFSVDLTPMEDISIFDRARGDTLEVRGGFNGWDCDNPDDCLLQRVVGNLFEAAVPLTAVPATEQNYKFYLNLNDEAFRAAFDGQDPPSGWEEPISTTGANRKFIFDGNPDVDQFLGEQFFNDILPGNILPEGTSVDVTFNVRMDSALVNQAAPFDPATQNIYIELLGDAIWAFTQGLPRNADGDFQVDTTFVLTDDDGDGLYSGTLTVNGPTYAAIQYKYTFGTGLQDLNPEEGGSTAGIGRRRTRYIVPNADGSWPAAWSFPEEQYQPTGNLPFETNPVATSVEAVDGEIPSEISLSDNYPNPFNPSTTFEYSVTAQERVTLKVFDLNGRLVQTLVDGIQPAAVYRVSFDAGDLASGMYLYQLKAGSQIITKKMLLVK